MVHHFANEEELRKWLKEQEERAANQIVEMVPCIYPTHLIGGVAPSCACPKPDPTKPMPQVIYWGGYCPIHSVRSM